MEPFWRLVDRWGELSKGEQCFLPPRLLWCPRPSAHLEKDPPLLFSRVLEMFHTGAFLLSQGSSLGLRGASWALWKQEGTDVFLQLFSPYSLYLECPSCPRQGLTLSTACP